MLYFQNTLEVGKANNSIIVVIFFRLISIETPTYDGTGSPTPTATVIPTEPTPEPLQHAWYAYDGDGNMVKGIVNSTVTFYPGRHYNKEVTTAGTKVQKFYFAIGQTIAVRTLQDSNDTLQWILSDHLGSASTTANADGTWNSTIQYTAFGEIRLTKGITPTKYRYTGQLAQAELGLDFYVSRFYDPLTGHFTQADTIIPEPGKAQGFDRYAYANYNPIKYNDPSGHCPLCVVATVAGGVLLGSAIYSNFIHEPQAPADGNASNVLELLYLGYEHADHANIVGEGLQDLQNDPSIQSAQEKLIEDIRGDSRYGKEPFNVPVSEPMDFTANGPDGNWWNGAITGNPSFWMVHTATLYAINAKVTADGTIEATWKIDDKFDYLPDWIGRLPQLKEKPGRYFAYNGFAQAVAPIYHGVLKAPSYRTNAYWKQIHLPESKDKFTMPSRKIRFNERDL